MVGMCMWGAIVVGGEVCNLNFNIFFNYQASLAQRYITHLWITPSNGEIYADDPTNIEYRYW